MYQLYIANKNYSSWSLRPWVLLSTLDIGFTEHLHTFKGYGRNDHFRNFSPSGLVPCLTDGPVTVWDSLAICEYVAEQYPRVWPADRTARAYARSASAEMHSGFGHLRTVCSMSCGQRVQLRAIDTTLQSQLERLQTLWEQGLNQFGGPFLAGAHFSAVDAFFCPVAFRVQTYQLPLRETAQTYVDRLLALPSMQAWYRAALAEVERDADHEAEILQYGVITHDYRAVAGIVAA